MSRYCGPLDTYPKMWYNAWMSKYLLGVVLALSISCATLLLPTLPETVFPSVGIIVYNDGESWCSAWSINDHGYWVTAAHCVSTDSPMTMGGQRVKARKVFGGVDLAVLNGPSAPALALSRTTPRIGDDVYIVGWSKTPWLIPFFEKIARLDVINPGDTWERNMVITGGIGPGASGSPVLNTSGEVVSVVQGGFHTPPIILGVPFDVMWDVLHIYTPTPGTLTETTGEDCSFGWVPFSNRCDDSPTVGTDIDGLSSDPKWVW